MFDSVERCQKCGTLTPRWYLRLATKIMIVVVAIALLILLIHMAGEPGFEKPPPPE